MSIDTLSGFRAFSAGLPEQGGLMPVLFIGHGAPMNGIEDNEFSRRWAQLGKDIQTPAAVLVVSAHWFTRGTRITAMAAPKTIHDFRGFPKALFDVRYPSPGSPALAQEAADLIRSTPVALDHDWGLDHGAWTIVRHMYPNANIPVLQLSIDYTKSAQAHYELAKELAALRRKGVLIMGSGNMIHNLGMISWDMMQGGGYDWALALNDTMKRRIVAHDHQGMIHYETLGKEARLAIPTPEHYLPVIYSLGVQVGEEQVQFFNDKAVGGSLTMTSLMIG